MIEEVYRRIAALRDNPVFIHVVPQEEALAQARAAKGPLAGVPFAIKDNIDVAGIPTTAACPSFSYVPKSTAPAVQKLLDAGAVLVGKTNLDQFATGLVGTDTAGSGRVPAAFNNLVGLKPTRGLVSTDGVVPACRSLDCVSVFAPTCREALRVVELMQEQRGAAVSFSAQAFRFAVPRQLEFHGDRAYADLFSRALSRGAEAALRPVRRRAHRGAREIPARHAARHAAGD